LQLEHLKKMNEEYIQIKDNLLNEYNKTLNNFNDVQNNNEQLVTKMKEMDDVMKEQETDLINLQQQVEQLNLSNLPLQSTLEKRQTSGDSNAPHSVPMFFKLKTLFATATLDQPLNQQNLATVFDEEDMDNFENKNAPTNDDKIDSGKTAHSFSFSNINSNDKAKIENTIRQEIETIWKLKLQQLEMEYNLQLTNLRQQYEKIK